MAIQLKSARVERWPVAADFAVAHGAHVDIIVAEVAGKGAIGRGEGTPVAALGEDAATCRDQILRAAAHIGGLGTAAARAAVQELLPPGAARNALDCALWELEAKENGLRLWQLAGCDAAPTARVTAFTLLPGSPGAMAEQAATAEADGYSLLRIELTGGNDRLCVTGARRGAPNARLIVDAAARWGEADILSEAEALADLGAEMIVQPVPVGADALLDPVYAPVPFVAGDSCQTAADVARIGAFYDGVNIRLDHAGGLTEALRIADAADAAGLAIMVSSAVSTSLAILPAFVLAQRAKWVDLGGPARLAEDRDGGFEYRGGRIGPPVA